MALKGIGASVPRRSHGATRSTEETPAAETRALVPVAEIQSQEKAVPLSQRPAAPFLAHLIATARGEPQTRDHRRAEPATAARAYAAAARLRAAGKI